MKKSKLINFNPIYECDKGWWPLIDECIVKLEEEVERSKIDFKILQIKEKLGGLRIYISSGTDIVFKIINNYEWLSYHICEICGEFWTSKNRESHGWWKTLCDKCAEKNKWD